MAEDLHVADTHALLWFITDDKRLSTRAERVFSNAVAGLGQVLISTISLAESVRLVEKGTIRLRGQLLDHIAEAEGLYIVPFDVETFREMLSLPSSVELHDRIIAATARLHDARLITRDPVFGQLIKTIW